MKTKYFEKGLALAGTVLVLVAVGAAANSALADETSHPDTDVNATQVTTAASTTTTDASKAIAESASLAAANDAVEALIGDTRLDLDIRMLGQSPTLLADRS